MKHFRAHTCSHEHKHMRTKADITTLMPKVKFTNSNEIH